MPRPYPPQFRRRALELVESGRTVRDVAASLGIAESALHRWRQRDLGECPRSKRAGRGASLLTGCCPLRAEGRFERSAASIRR